MTLLRPDNNLIRSLGAANFKPVTGGVIAASFLLFFAFGFGPNLDLALLSCVILCISTILLWRTGGSPILLYLFLFQWLQSSIAIFYANVAGVAIDELSNYDADLHTATIYCLLGCLAFAIGCRLAVGRWTAQHRTELKRDALQVRVHSLLVAYVFLNAVSISCTVLSHLVPALSQPLLAAAFLKWGAFFALTYVAFSSNRLDRRIWVAAFAFEFLIGLGGYFSGFKFVFIVTLVAMVAAQFRLSFARMAVGAFCAGLMFVAGIYWQTVKNDYRAYVAQGSYSQSVNVTYADALGKLFGLVSAATVDDLSKGAEQMILRIGYTEYFGVVLKRVPYLDPYQNGALWADAVTRIFMPRALFPSKSILDDSAMTNQFTGLGVSGFAEGTSISLGYMVESYIDFGPFGQFGPVFLVGLFCGWIHRLFSMSRYSGPLVGASVSLAALLTTGAIEISAAKMVGGLAVAVIVYWPLQRYLARSYIPFFFGKHRPVRLNNRAM